MSKIFKISFIFVLAGMFFSSCVDKKARDNSFDPPHIDPLPIGKVYTIEELLALQAQESTIAITDTASVYGVVTADEASGNLYKAVFIQDGNYAIELYMKATSGLRIGDSIRVYLKGATISEYSGTPQIQDLDPNNITILKNNCEIKKDMLTMDDYGKFEMYLGHLVQISDVEFTDEALSALTYADPAGYGSRTIKNCSSDNTITVRTSNYASFAYQTLPYKHGNISGILTRYKSGSNVTWQLTLRSPNEVVFNENRCQGMGDGSEENPFDISAAIFNQGQTGEFWVKGVIVGSTTSRNITSATDITWNPPFNEEHITNVIIGDTEDEGNIGNCLYCYLTTSVREQLNLYNNPENYHKHIIVKGNLRSFYNIAGVQVTEFKLSN